MGKKIMIVDDEKDIATSLAELLREVDYECVTAFNGQEAIEKLKHNNDIKILIVDYKMTDMTGEELIINLSSKDKSLKFILYTGSIEYYVTKELKKIGMTDNNIFYKPIIDIQKLVDRLEEI